MGVECCYCWKWDAFDNVQFDLHEIIFSRGSMRGVGDDGILAIMDVRNCGWVHRVCHPLAEGGDGRIRAITYLFRYEGFTHVSEFTRDMVQYTSNWLEFAKDVTRAWEDMNNMLPLWDVYDRN